jgi:uncharacterized membrane protein YfcA
MFNLEIFLTMLVLGLLLGFIGAGGSAFILALLVTVFQLDIDLAMGTGLAAMVFVMISGAISHVREGNTVVPLGISIGISSAIGAYVGVNIVTFFADIGALSNVIYITVVLLYLSALLAMYRERLMDKLNFRSSPELINLRSVKFWLISIVIGLFFGALCSAFGSGFTILLQVILMTVFGISLTKAIGTAMMVVIPVAFSGGIGYFQAGKLDFILLAMVVAGSIIGTYIGAKFTRRVPSKVLKLATALTPVVAASLMLLRNIMDLLK